MPPRRLLRWLSVLLVAALRDSGSSAERITEDVSALETAEAPDRPAMTRGKDAARHSAALQLDAADGLSTDAARHGAELQLEAMSGVSMEYIMQLRHAQEVLFEAIEAASEGRRKAEADLISRPEPPGLDGASKTVEKEAAKAVMGFFYSPYLVSFWKVALLSFVLYVAVCVVITLVLLPNDVKAEVPALEGDHKMGGPRPEIDWMGFQPRALEVRWLQESYQDVISSAAELLGAAALGYIAFRAVRFERRSIPGSCLPVYWPLAWAELITLGLMSAVSFHCMVKPSGIYWIVLGFFFFYILASTLPPFAFSCTQLVEQCKDTIDKFTLQASRHADCSLEGYTAQQTIMTWILVLPWVIPRRSLMPLAWLWLFAVYLSWTVAYRYSIPTAAKTFTWGAVIFHFGLQNMTFAISCTEKSNLERIQRVNFLAELRMKEASRRLFQILKYMVPVHVILPMIKRPGEVIAEQIDRVSILFVVIDEFDEVADRLSPEEVLKFLNEYFTKFDDICEVNRVTKIETVGEEYVACVGVMPEDVEENKREGHSKILNRLLIAADQILKLQSDSVRFKMGLHSGPIVAGVIGTHLPRYRLFGDTINTAARLMQKGEVGQLQFGEETHKDLPDGVETRLRGNIELKGKGNFKAYLCEKVHDSPPLAPALRPKRASIFASMVKKDEQKGEDGKDAENMYTYTPAAAEVAPSGKVAEDPESLNTADIPVHTDRDEAFEKVLAETKDDADTEMKGEQFHDWMRWHHENKVLKKTTGGLDLQLVVLAVLTLVEGIYMCRYQETDKSNKGIPAHLRLPIFLLTRIGVIMMIFTWRMLLSSDSEWVRGNGNLLMYLRLVSWLVIACLLFISYDDLTPDDVAIVKEGEVLVEIAPFSQNFSLVFVLVYTIITRVEAMLWKPALVFLPLSIGLMVQAQFQDNENIVASIPAKVFFIVNTLLSCAVNYTDEQTSRKQYKAKIRVEATTSRVQGILSTLMPPLVLEEIRSLPVGAPQPTHTYKVATICQSDLCGFTQLSATRTPREVVQFMGELFGSFDDLTDKYGVYKVETVGDAYIAGMAEAPLTPTNSPVNVVLFGLAMIDAVHAWSRNMGESVTCRVGVHYGECIGGVVGTGMQRYHLFGKLLCGMEILESTAPEGHVQLSQVCKAALEKQGAKEVQQLVFKQREEPQLKTSKGLIHEYESVGGRTFVVTMAGGGAN